MEIRGVLCAYVVMVVLTLSSAMEDFCSKHKYPNNETSMQFTKEASFEEFAIVGKFKGLHCCAKGYSSIEWYKDGKPYPWPLMLSQLILYPASANQTVYTLAVTKEDAGNYTCLLRNDSLVHSHTINLKVFDKIPDDPKITYISEDTSAAVGENVRLFCEAFAGRVDLPDAHNEAVWKKTGLNDTLDEDSHVHQEKVHREDGQTFGTYLIIENIQKGDFGRYVCKITKPGKTIELPVYITQKVKVEYLEIDPFPLEAVIWIIGSAILLTSLLVACNMRYGLDLRVHFKDNFGIPEENDGKVNDALILYVEKDSDYALGELLPRLENRSYKCQCLVFPPVVNTWKTDLSAAVEQSRRLVAVLSPSVLNGSWDSATVCDAVNQLRILSPKTVVIFLKKPPVEGPISSDDKSLKSLLRLVHVVEWKTPIDRAKWQSIQLRMPPVKKKGDDSEQSNTRRNGNSSRLNFDENLYDLM